MAIRGILLLKLEINGQWIESCLDIVYLLFGVNLKHQQALGIWDTIGLVVAIATSMCCDQDGCGGRIVLLLYGFRGMLGSRFLIRNLCTDDRKRQKHASNHNYQNDSYYTHLHLSLKQFELAVSAKKILLPNYYYSSNR